MVVDSFGSYYGLLKNEVDVFFGGVLIVVEFVSFVDLVEDLVFIDYERVDGSGNIKKVFEGFFFLIVVNDIIKFVFKFDWYVRVNMLKEMCDEVFVYLMIGGEEVYDLVIGG